MQIASTAVLAATLLGAALPAQADFFAVAQSSDGARVVLYSKPGPCVAGAKLAEHISREGEKIPGCWVLYQDTVLVSFLDGERGNIPVAHLKRAVDL